MTAIYFPERGGLIRFGGKFRPSAQKSIFKFITSDGLTISPLVFYFVPPRKLATHFPRANRPERIDEGSFLLIHGN